jgi:hypothetical protein
MKSISKYLAIASFAFFILSEIDKNPKERLLFSKESKITSALSTLAGL